MISVSDYLNNHELLEAYYTPYQQKCNIVDTIINELQDKDENNLSIDYAQLHQITTSIFIKNITNIDMTQPDENGLLGYDLLESKNELQPLIDVISDEYERYNDILRYKLDNYRESYSVNYVLNSLIDNAYKAVENINIKEIINNFNEILKLQDLLKKEK